MADYIDREGLLQIESLLKTDIIENNKVAIWLYEQIMHDIEAYPSADVAPVRHGRWVKPVPGDGDPCCSECKAKQLYLPYVGYFYSKYCPYCGAKLDAKENDNEFD